MPGPTMIQSHGFARFTAAWIVRSCGYATFTFVTTWVAHPTVGCTPGDASASIVTDVTIPAVAPSTLPPGIPSPLRLLRGRTRAPARRGAGAREAPGGLLVDRQHDRAVHDQSFVRPLLQQVGEEAVDQPLATRDHGSAQPDPNQAVH